MAITEHALDTTSYNTLSYTAGTIEKRDVSDVLDLFDNKEAPFLGYVSWGAPSGGNKIEWVTENLGVMWFYNSAAVASTGLTMKIASNAAYLDTLTGVVKQINEGTVCYAYSSTDGEHGLFLVESVASTFTMSIEFLSGQTTSIAASTKIFIIGSPVQEGSDFRADKTRERALASNKFEILRQDIYMTGSQMETDMYAVANDFRHQIELRTVEMQRERESTSLFSVEQARASDTASLMNGVLGFLKGQTGSHIDSTTTSFSETAFNNVAAALWENGATPNAFFAHQTQIRKFTTWDRSRIRMSPRENLGGAHISSYMTDIGIEIDLVPLRRCPTNIAFVLDTSKISLRAKKNRKLMLDRLGKSGDYEKYQLISEFSMEIRGYNQGQHGMFDRLT